MIQPAGVVEYPYEGVFEGVVDTLAETNKLLMETMWEEGMAEGRMCSCKGFMSWGAYLQESLSVRYCPWCGRELITPEGPLSQGELKEVRAMLKRFHTMDNRALTIKEFIDKYDIACFDDIVKAVEHERLGG